MPKSPNPTPPAQRRRKQMTAMRNRQTVARAAATHLKVRKSKGG